MKSLSPKALSTKVVRPRARALRVLGIAATLAFTGTLGCGTTPGTQESSFEGNGKPVDDREVGEVSLDLQVDDAILQTVKYEVMGGTFDKTGTIDVTHAPRVSAVVGGVPLGTGYTAKLTADGTGTKVIHCAGSAIFDVTMPGITPVNVHMACQESLNVPVPRGASAALWAVLLGAGLVSMSRRRPSR